MSALPLENPHDAQLELAWAACRYGLERCSAEPVARARVLDWISRMEPAFPGSPWLCRWREVVDGRAPDSAHECMSVPEFIALSPARQSFWRPLVQSNPFACVVPGRTTRERRALLASLVARGKS
jgi:hypothetical protein